MYNFGPHEILIALEIELVEQLGSAYQWTRRAQPVL
jgi:hypothetical protein